MKNREKETDVRSEKVRRLIERPLPLVLRMGTVIIILFQTNPAPNNSSDCFLPRTEAGNLW